MGLEMSALKPLIRYLEVLVRQYPKPITQSELAHESKVTKSAVSKVRDNLLRLCDMRVLAFEKKMVLKTDSKTFGEIFNLFLIESKIDAFFTSSYAKGVIEKMKIHERLAKQLKSFSYSEYFNQEDTDWAANIVLRNISSFKFEGETFKLFTHAIKGYENRDLTQFGPYVQLITKSAMNPDIAVFENEEELIKTLKLRDKVYSFITDNISQFLESLEIIKNIKDPKKRSQYIEVYSETVTYILNKISEEVTQQIQAKCVMKKIPFLPEYSKIGAFFSGVRVKVSKAG